MKRPILLVISAGLAVGLTGFASAQTQPSPPPMQPAQPAPAQPMQPGPAQPGTAVAGGTVTLNPPNNQGPKASAQLAQQGDNVVITLHAPADETTAVVFSGKCAPNGKPQATGPGTALQRLSNGTSQTTLPHAKVSDLVSTPHAIVVQGGNVAPYCGDVSTLTSAPPP
ncbi:MAG TPA: hypothetical protein VGG89_00835 [Candidatus Baltobacteraceae bacterium]|jgi:hypothetical protein